MKPNYQVSESDLKKLNMNIEQFEKELLVACKDGLAALGMRIVKAAQTRLKRNGNIASGFLANSGATKETPRGEILAGFSAHYAYWVEFGRRAGGYPPFQAIFQWVRKKHFAKDEEEAESIAYGIQRAIGKKGTKPHPFLYPSMQRNKGLYYSIIDKATKKVLNKDYR